MSITQQQPNYFFPFDYHKEYRYPTILITDDFISDMEAFITYFSNKGFIVALTNQLRSIFFADWVDTSNLFIGLATFEEPSFPYKGLTYRQTNKKPPSDQTTCRPILWEDPPTEENFHALYEWWIEMI